MNESATIVIVERHDRIKKMLRRSKKEILLKVSIFESSLFKREIHCATY